MVSRKNYPVVSCVTSFFMGALLGGGIALLTTPQSERMIRRQLKDLARHFDETNCGTDDKRRIDEATRKIHDYYEEAKRSSSL